MTFKQFKQWCNDRACDGCWGYQTAIYCIETMRIVKAQPFWKREKVWNEFHDGVVSKIVEPINRKIQEMQTTNADRCVSCGAIIPEGSMVCTNCNGEKEG